MKNKKLMIIPPLLILTALISIYFRLQFHNNAQNLSDGYYMDAETGTPYLTEMDSYYHLRMTRNISQYGHPGDTDKDGEYWDTMSYAPEGRSVHTYRPLMAYIAIGVYRIASLFGTFTLEQVVYWLNMFMSALVIIPVFLLTSEMCGSLGGIVAAVLSTLNYGYFIHTIPGFYDTDGVIAWVSCLFFYFAIRFVNSLEGKKRSRIILNGAGLAVSFWALYLSWYVYYLFAAILSAALIAFTFFRPKDTSSVPAKHRETAERSRKRNKHGEGTKTDEKKRPPMYPLFLAGGIILLILLLEHSLISGIAGLLKRVFVKSGGLFPNIFVSISEMRTPALWAGGLVGLFQMKVLSETNIGIINGVGGIVPFLSALAMCVLFIRKIIKKEALLQHFLLIIWYAVTLVLAFRGWRFIMLFAMPISILAGNLAGWVCTLMDEGKMMDRTVYKGMIAVLMLFPALYGVYKSSADSVPSGNSQMGQVMASIREKTPEDTILLSWWDYGYFFEEKAKRRTLFDGGSQNGSRSYWVAKAFASSDEKLSANILRMLSGSGDQACDRMLEIFGENEDTLLLMDHVLSAGKDGAGPMLAQAGADDITQSELLGLLFPENLSTTECIITPEMSRISGWFATFGMQKGSDVFGQSDYAIAMDRLITDSPKEGENVYQTEHGFHLIINKMGDSYEAYTSMSATKGEQPVRIDRVIVLNSKGCMEYFMNNSAFNGGDNAAVKSDEPESTGNNPGWTVILKDDGSRASISMVTKRMADSTFGKMLYCQGAGLSDFTLEPELSNTVLVYRLR